MLVLVAPGQGAQKPGFLTPWLDLPGVSDRLTWWSAVTGLDLIHYGTKAAEEEIRDTAVAQPLLVAAGLASARALCDAAFPQPAPAEAAADPEAAEASAGPEAAEAAEATAGPTGPLSAEELPRLIGAVAGHSVGELTAAAVSRMISDEAALVLVRQRGLAMAEAAARSETGMAAVLGGEQDVVLAHLAKHGLVAANINGAGQIVAAGSDEGLTALADDKPEGVRRVVRLKVAGAFHTEHMTPAVDTLRALMAGAPVTDPHTRYVSNRDGAVVASGAEIARRLVDQVSTPVRWDLCMETFRALGVTAVVELAPGGTLTGLAKRALPGVRTLALKTPDDLDAARALVAEHAHPVARSSAEEEPRA